MADVNGAGERNGRVNILLVDDHPENLVALRAVLARPDYNLVSVTSGNEALLRVLREDFAVVLLDVFMPDMDGFETAAIIRGRERSRHIPIIFLTAAGRDVSFSQRGYSLGAVDYLTKPVDPEVVRAKVAVFVDLYRMRREVARQGELLRDAERRERERQFRLLFDGTSDALLIADDEGRFADANPAASVLFGVPRAALLGRRVADFVAPGAKAPFEGERAWQEFLAKGERAGEFRVARPDGTSRLADYRASARVMEGRHMFSLRDVTERRRAENMQRFLAHASAVLGASLDLRAILTHVAELAVGEVADWCVVDLRDGDGLRSVAVSHADPAKATALRAILEGAPHDVAGTVGAPSVIRTGRAELHADVPHELLPPAARDGERRDVLRQLGLHSAMVVPLRVRERTLGAITFVSADPARRYDGGDLDLASELATRAALAVENARLYREAQEAIRARDEFLSVASHELRTPLTSLQLQVQSVLRGARKSPRTQELTGRMAEKFDVIERSILRLTKLINDLLDVSRVTGRLVQLQPERVDVSATVREVASRFVEDLRRANCEVVLQADTAVVAQLDRSRLDEILTNLLSNAIKYGAGKPIEVTVAAVDGFARVTVSDQGIGIATEDQARIFERFERAASTRHYGGLGLGLWIVRRYLEAMGGSIRVASTPGEGSTFAIEIPLVARPPEVLPATEAPGAN